jgi:hypothetical protein
LGSTDPSLSAQLQLRALEDAVNVWVADLASGPGKQQPIAAQDSQAAALETLLDRYRAISHNFLSTLGSPGIDSGSAGKASTPGACMRVERRSRELVVAWAGYCLFDAAARHTHPTQMREGGVALLWQDLRHLVLSDRAITDTALHIADYLRAHYMQGKPAFM